MEKITPNIVKDEQLKQYFLGQLAPATAENLEERIAADEEELFERAQMIETELLDDYLRENLSVAEKKLFAENYLTTAERRANLHSAENLWRVSGGQISAVSSPVIFAPPTFRQKLDGYRRNLWLIGTAVAILLIGIIISWIFSKPAPEIAGETKTAKFPAPVAKNDSPNLPKNPSPENSIPDDSSSSETAVTKRKSAPVLRDASKNTVVPQTSAPSLPKNAPLKKNEGNTIQHRQFITLAPGNLRDQGEQFIKILRTSKNVSLRLDLPKDAAKYQNYRAILKNADGEIVSVLPHLKKLKISLSAASLENRTYLIFLEGENAPNAPEPITEYVFRVDR